MLYNKALQLLRTKSDMMTSEIDFSSFHQRFISGSPECLICDAEGGNITAGKT